MSARARRARLSCTPARRRRACLKGSSTGRGAAAECCQHSSAALHAGAPQLRRLRVTSRAVWVCAGRPGRMASHRQGLRLRLNAKKGIAAPLVALWTTNVLLLVLLRPMHTWPDSVRCSAACSCLAQWLTQVRCL